MFAQHSWYFRNALVRANYKSAVKGIDYSPVYLERFFRNLLLSEQWDLRNRYLHIHPTEEWSVQPNLADPTSAGQVQDKYGTSAPISSENQLYTANENIIRLIQAMGYEKLSIKEIMASMELRGRDNFLNLYLNPAIESGFVRLLYPDSPRHPRQKYLLTVKGKMVLHQLQKD
jgi:hypothetical protein